MIVTEPATGIGWAVVQSIANEALTLFYAGVAINVTPAVIVLK